MQYVWGWKLCQFVWISALKGVEAMSKRRKVFCLLTVRWSLITSPLRHAFFIYKIVLAVARGLFPQTELRLVFEPFTIIILVYHSLLILFSETISSAPWRNLRGVRHFILNVASFLLSHEVRRAGINWAVENSLSFNTHFKMGSTAYLYHLSSSFCLTLLFRLSVY